MTKRDYIDDCFRGDVARAVEWEERALSIGTEFLPEYVRVVRDKEREPDSRYWAWLTDQFERSLPPVTI